MAQLLLPFSFLPLIFPKSSGLASTSQILCPRAGLERQPVFPFQLQDGIVECWGSHTLLGCQMLGCQAVAYF